MLKIYTSVKKVHNSLVHIYDNLYSAYKDLMILMKDIKIDYDTHVNVLGKKYEYYIDYSDIDYQMMNADDMIILTLWNLPCCCIDATNMQKESLRKLVVLAKDKNMTIVFTSITDVFNDMPVMIDDVLIDGKTGRKAIDVLYDKNVKRPLLSFPDFLKNRDIREINARNKAEKAFNILIDPINIGRMLAVVDLGISPLNTVAKILEDELGTLDTIDRQTIGREITFILKRFGYTPSKDTDKVRLRDFSGAMQFRTGKTYIYNGNPELEIKSVIARR